MRHGAPQALLGIVGPVKPRAARKTPRCRARVPFVLIIRTWKLLAASSSLWMISSMRKRGGFLRREEPGEHLAVSHRSRRRRSLGNEAQSPLSV